MAEHIAFPERVSRIKAIFFDIHHTITRTRIGFVGLAREAAEVVGLDFSRKTDEQLREVIVKMNSWLRNYQYEEEVDIHWGTEPEDWIEHNRKMLGWLGITDVSNRKLIEMERAWKEITKSNWEFIVENAKEVLEELKRRGYVLGICTRRNDDPDILLRRWGIRELFSSVQWTAVAGYAKPSPYTLVQAASETGFNPLLCAYVGNIVDADVKAAMSAEMLPILTTWANPSERNLAPKNAIVIESLDELLELFTGPTS